MNIKKLRGKCQRRIEKAENRILKKYLKGKSTQASLALEYGVSQTTIGDIVRRVLKKKGVEVLYGVSIVKGSEISEIKERLQKLRVANIGG